MPLADPTDLASAPPHGAPRRRVGTTQRRGPWHWPVRVLAWVAAAYGGLAVVLLAVGWVAGDRTWWLYITNLSVIYWLAPTVPLAVLAVAARWRVAAVPCLIGALVWLVLFGPLFVPQRVAAEGDEARRLRVVSYNVSPEPDVSHVADLVAREQPDVLLLQELLPEMQDDLVDHVPSLPYHHFIAVNDAAPGGGGTAVLSRLPISGTRPVEGLPEAARPTDLVEIDTPAGPVTVVSLHLTSPCRSCTDDPPRVEVNDLGLEARHRAAEARQVAQALPDGPVVVGGDFNSSTFNTPRRRLLGAGLVDLHQAAGAGPGFTRHDWHAWFRIDWLLASSDVTPVRTWVEHQDGSDHEPVVADVVLPPR